MADEVKVYLKSIAHSTTHDGGQLTLRNSMNADLFKMKVKNWFTKTWLPNIRRWCLAYRLDDLILCNTKNSTERLNEDLRYDELLTVIIESFIPKHYSKYVALNIRYGDGCNKYTSGVPEFLRNGPKQVVDMLLDEMYRVTDDIAVRSLGNATYIVESFEEGTRIRKEYRTYFGNTDQFCSCTCYNFRHYRMLCKHFSAKFQFGKATFYDLTRFFLNHRYMVLDRKIVTGDFGSSLTEIREETGDNEIFRYDSENDSLDVSCESDQDTFRELPLKQSLLKRKKVNIRAQLKQIIDLTYTTNNLEIAQELDEKVQSLLSNFMLKICEGDLIQLPKTENRIAGKRSIDTKGQAKEYDELPRPKKKKHPFSGRVGETADMIMQFYRAKVELAAEEREESATIESVIEVSDTENSNEFSKLPNSMHDKVG